MSLHQEDDDDIINLHNENLMRILQNIRESFEEENSKRQREIEENDSNKEDLIDFDDTYEITTINNKSDDGSDSEKDIEYLDLSEWAHLSHIPESVFELFTLRALHLKKCYSLTRISPSIQHLHKLTELDLSRCTSLTSIPTEICSCLFELKRLSLSYCPSLTRLPNDWKGMRNLTSLYLEGCCNLDEIPNMLWLECTNLVYLGLARLTCLESLPPGLKNLTKLKTLNIRDCPNLKTLSTQPDLTLSPLEELHSIFATGTPMVDLPVEVLASLRNLRILSLDNCVHIPSKLKDDKRLNVVNVLRLLVNTRDKASALELVLWKTLGGWSEDIQIRATNRDFCGAGIDMIIQGVIPFLCGIDDIPLFSFCFGQKKNARIRR